MIPDMKAMEKQLKLWGEQIEELADENRTTDIQSGFEVFMRIDELKVLYAIAQAKFAEFQEATDPELVHLKAEMNTAWNDLDTAIKDPMP